MGSLDGWVRYWSSRAGSRVVLSGPDGAWTWQRLAEVARDRTDGLRRAGVRPGDPVAFGGDDPCGSVATLVACACLGAVGVPDATGGGQAAAAVDPSPATGPGFDAGLLRFSDGAAAVSHANAEAVAVAGMTANGIVPDDVLALPGLLRDPAPVAMVLAALHAGARIRFGAYVPNGDLPEPATVVLIGPETQDGPSLPGLDGPGEPPRAIVVPGPVDDAWRAACVAAGLPRPSRLFGVPATCGSGLQAPPGTSGAELVPLIGQRARVVGPDGRALPPGAAGELELGGSAVPSAARSADGWLPTGQRAVACGGNRFRLDAGRGAA